MLYSILRNHFSTLYMCHLPELCCLARVYTVKHPNSGLSPYNGQHAMYQFIFVYD